MDNRQVRFIRKNGRVIPIVKRSKKDKKAQAISSTVGRVGAVSVAAGLFSMDKKSGTNLLKILDEQLEPEIKSFRPNTKRVNALNRIKKITNARMKLSGIAKYKIPLMAGGVLAQAADLAYSLNQDRKDQKAIQRANKKRGR